MSTYRVVFKGKDSRQVMLLDAKNEDDARRQAEEAQARRQQRFGLTFARLDRSLETGQLDPMLARDPRSPAEFTKEMHKAQTELRKRDQARYDSGELKITKVEKL